MEMEEKTLKIKNCTVLTLPVGTDLKQIEKVDAYDEKNTFEKLIDRQFEGMINLKKIDFDGCNITNIEELAFQGLTNLVELDLRNNKIKKLHGNLFKDLQNLEKILLQFNGIQRLSSNLFKENRALLKIDLTSNQIFAIERSTFIVLDNLTTLGLNDNQCVQEIFNGKQNMIKINQTLMLCSINYELYADSHAPVSVDSMFQQIKTLKNQSPHYIWFVVVSGLSSFLSIFGVTVIMVLGAKILKLNRMQYQSQENVDGAAEVTEDIYQNTF